MIAPEKFVGRRIELAGDQPTPRAMADALGEALGHPVRHTEVSLDTIEDPDMHAMWTFLRGDGYRVDLPALHAEFPHVGWTSFAEWATDALEAR